MPFGLFPIFTRCVSTRTERRIENPFKSIKNIFLCDIECYCWKSVNRFLSFTAFGLRKMVIKFISLRYHFIFSAVIWLRRKLFEGFSTTNFNKLNACYSIPICEFDSSSDSVIMSLFLFRWVEIFCQNVTQTYRHTLKGKLFDHQLRR